MGTKKNIYFVPGLAASPTIFENIHLDPEQFNVRFIEWKIPLDKNEPIEEYAKRMCASIEEENPILCGVSFGGVMVQEMAKQIENATVIIISSIKSNKELPTRLQFVKNTNLYKLLPAKQINNIEKFSKYAFGDFAKKRVALYQKFLSVRDESYLHWAVYNVLHWKREEADPKVIHIHGDADEVFPEKNIKTYHNIPGGTHIMILNKGKAISKLLSDLCFKQ